MYTEFFFSGGGELKIKSHIELIVTHAYAIKQGILYVNIVAVFSIK